MAKDVTAGNDWAPDPDNGDFECGALERAQAAVDSLKEVYVTDWGPAALAEMREALASAGGDRAGGFQTLYRLAHDMKGQGGTFGFPLLTLIGEALCRLTADRCDASEGELSVLAAHLEAARHIIAERIEGDGGAEGDRLMRDLQVLTRRHMH